ncbi:hypothetical protein BB560_005696 [Smittium megazygosporum]|uniref:Pre-mRNA processing factor 4 (PRP4)-like domain-containing protein n=1 Tax=Smittium megazygosporum TaxID=133381 RepID=A0A2T9Z193_9FUNG|nr:hypothetical protein BB560_005696 [Smittium megazygosporum]
MDLLRSAISSEITKRKKALEIAADSKQTSSEPAKRRKKYLTAREIELSEKKLSEFSNKTNNTENSSAGSPDVNTNSVEKSNQNPDSSATSESSMGNLIVDYNISEAEIIKKLRSRGEPIRLFGETHNQRKIRLRTLELMDEKSEDTTIITPKLFSRSPDKIYTLVYAYFKRMLIEWEQFLDENEAEKNTTAGKLAAATCRQSSEYMKPFFRLLKKKVDI